MKPFEFNNEMQDLKKKFEKEKQKLYRKYIDSNAKYKIGDIITDGNTIIKISQITGQVWDSVPIPYYRGLLYTKKITPYKSREYGSIFFRSDIQLIEKKERN